VQALDAWEEKAALPQSPLESAWLHHEIGRSYLELNDFNAALVSGERSKADATAAQDDRWTLNATLLIAQSQRMSSLM
jgi:hypothetical protein